MADPNIQALFTRGPVPAWAYVDTAETSSTAPVNIKLLVSTVGYPNGCKVKDFRAFAQGASSNDRIQLWKDVGFTRKLQWRDFLITGTTPSATVQGAYTYFSLEDWQVLWPGQSIWVSCYGGIDAYVEADVAHFEQDNP